MGSPSTSSERPFARLRVTQNDLGDRADDCCEVIVDDKVIAYLPITEVNWTRSFDQNMGRITVSLLSEHCQVHSRAPRFKHDA